jgi:hypothetical protein
LRLQGKPNIDIFSIYAQELGIVTREWIYNKGIKWYELAIDIILKWLEWEIILHSIIILVGWERIVLHQLWFEWSQNKKGVVTK